MKQEDAAPASVIWLNGGFGSGKTTLAAVVRDRLPGSLEYDPERVGFLLREWVPAPPSGDFQDLPLWRTLTAQVAIEMARHYRGPVVVAMSLLNPAYRAQILQAITGAGIEVLHVFLQVSADELSRRITDQVINPEDADADASARAFRLGRIPAAGAAREHLAPTTLVLRSDQRSPDQLADLVVQRFHATRATPTHNASPEGPAGAVEPT